jgi:hypothetical protein
MKTQSHHSLPRCLRPALALLLAGLVLAGHSAVAATAPVELISRALLFGNPTRTAPQLSPDGTLLGFLAPRDGVMNLWVSPTGKLDQARPLTAEKQRPLRSYFWARNGTDLLYVQDTGGDENFLLHAVNAQTGAVRTLTPFEKTRVNIYQTSWSRPDEIVIGLNHRDPRWHDAWLLNVRTGALTLLHENQEKLSGYILDDALRLRFALRSRPDGGSEVLKFGAPGAPLEVAISIDYEDTDNTSPLGLTQDGSTLYLRDSRGRDKSVLKAIAVEGGAERVLAEDARADIGGALRHPVTGRIEAYSVEYLRNEWHAIDPALAADFAFLSANLKGEWSPGSRTKDNRLWIVSRRDATIPGAYHLYDRTARKLTPLFSSRPELEGKPLVPMHPVEIKARDGLTLVSYLTLPAGTDVGGRGRPARPVPMVLLVHGGPWRAIATAMTPCTSGWRTAATPSSR